MDMLMVTSLVSTAVIAMLLMHLVMRFMEVVGRGGEGRVVAERGGGVEVVGGGGGGGERMMRRRRSEKRVRFDCVEEKSFVVDRFEGVVVRCGSAVETAAVVEGFGDDVVEDVGGDVEASESGLSEKSVELDCRGGVVGRDESALEEKLEEKDQRLLFEDISVSGLTEVEEIGGVEERKDGGSGSVHVMDESVDFGNENVVCSGLSEMVFSADSGAVDELFEEEEGGEAQSMDVEDGDCGGEEMEKELKDEVALPIENCIRNIEGGVTEEDNSVIKGCKNEFEETAEPKYVAVQVGGMTEEENCVNEGFKNEIEETAKPKDVADRIGGVIEEENGVNEGCKNEFEGKEVPKDVCVELKDEVMEERFGSSEEDDDWEGIEVSELYKDFTAAAAFVRKEEGDGKLIGNEVKMQLYGLQKIIMEGPCSEAQPMAIKMSARAKWNAWQRLGNMNPEDAMKQYITVVSGLNPEWGEKNSAVDDPSGNVKSKKLSISDPDQSKPPNESQTKKELTGNAEGIGTGSSSL